MVICISLSFAAGFGLLVRDRHRVRVTFRGLLSLDREIDRKLIAIGLPSGAEMLARQLAGLIAPSSWRSTARPP
jgi:Na+-driven multidrug efflux pump